jgi:hypothetical protein
VPLVADQQSASYSKLRQPLALIVTSRPHAAVSRRIHSRHRLDLLPFLRAAVMLHTLRLSSRRLLLANDELLTERRVSKQRLLAA